MMNDPEKTETNEIVHLSKEWAKKYVQDLKPPELSSESSKEEASEELLSSLRSASAYAWNKTERFLANEVKRHKINYEIIDPWEISQDIHRIFETTIKSYRDEINVQKLSVLVSEDIGNVRNKYTSKDARLIGFVSMQFHHTGEYLLDVLPSSHAQQLNSYFKVIDDHLYMPLQRMYNGAAQYEFNATELSIVHQLLPKISQIAEEVCAIVREKNPNHYCYSGHLSSEYVKISSHRDAEMFQIYILTSILEKSVEAVRQELFPLCLMLYPTLKVSWDLVWEMLKLLEEEISDRLTLSQYKVYFPYFKAMKEMFSPEVLPVTLEATS